LWDESCGVLQEAGLLNFNAQFLEKIDPAASTPRNIPAGGIEIGV
jgi:hypothetical protein